MGTLTGVKTRRRVPRGRMVIKSVMTSLELLWEP